MDGSLAKLDCQPHFISSVGSDPLGHCILSHNSQLKKDLIQVHPTSSTATYCLTLTDRGDLNLGIS